MGRAVTMSRAELRRLGIEIDRARGVARRADATSGAPDGAARGAAGGQGRGAWWAGPVAALDFEATHVDVREARPVAAALVVVEPDGRVVPDVGFRGLIDAGVAIPGDATRVHGITQEAVRRGGVPAGEACAAIVATLERLRDAGVPVTIQNARYDWPLLRLEAARHALALPEVPLVDPLVIDRRLQRSRQGGRRTLHDLAGYYGVAPGTAHDALEDGRTAVAVARRMGEHPAIRELTPEELHARQRAWFAAWRNSTNAYYKLQGRDDRIEGSWPDGVLGRTTEPPATRRHDGQEPGPRGVADEGAAGGAGDGGTPPVRLLRIPPIRGGTHGPPIAAPARRGGGRTR